jgi:hypothetical protein
MSGRRQTHASSEPSIADLSWSDSRSATATFTQILRRGARSAPWATAFQAAENRTNVFPDALEAQVNGC